jgi:predicted phosphodiesterase
MKDHPLFLRIISDIHIGEDRGDRAASKGMPIVEKIVEQTNKDKPDAFVDLGDRVMQTSFEEDGKNLTTLSKIFNKLSVPRLHSIGNHDECFMTRNHNRRALDLPKDKSYTQSIGSYTLVMWNPNVKIDREGCSLSYEDARWLEETLAMSDKPCIVFTHVPLDDDAIYNPKNNAEHLKPYFAHYPQNPFVRRIMEEAGNVVACFAGHRHVHRHNETNGIHYITVDCFSRRQKDNPSEPIGAYADLKIDENGQVSYELHGAEPLKTGFQKRLGL